MAFITQVVLQTHRQCLSENIAACRPTSLHVGLADGFVIVDVRVQLYIGDFHGEVALVAIVDARKDSIHRRSHSRHLHTQLLKKPCFPILSPHY